MNYILILSLNDQSSRTVIINTVYEILEINILKFVVCGQFNI